MARKTDGVVVRTIPAKTLQGILATHGASVKKQPELVQSNIYIQVTPEAILFSTNDLGTMQVTRFPLEGEGVAETMINYERFHSVVKLLKGDVKLAIDSEKWGVVVNDGQVRISGLNPDNYTTIRSCPEPQFHIESGSQLGDAVRRCAFACHTDARPALAGMVFSKNGNAVETTAASGVLFAIDTTTKLVEPDVPNFRFFVHYSNFKSLIALPDGPIGIHIEGPDDPKQDRDRVYLISGNWYAILRLAEDRFPLDVLRSQTPKTFSGMATVKGDDFDSAYSLAKITGRVTKTGREGSEETSDAIKATITIGNGTLTIASHGGGKEHGAKTTIDAETTGTGEFIINQMASPGLETLMNKERLTLAFTNEKAPYVFTSDKLPGYLTMMMPIVSAQKGGG